MRMRLASASVLAMMLSAGIALAEEIPVTLLQLNDVYELTPVQGEGGMARLATLRKRLQEKNPRTFMLLAGDVLSPSAIGTARDESGRPFAGRQMVDVLNEIGLDLATFGNHEFDLSREDFLRRLAESRFHWISANVRDSSGNRFPGVSDDSVLTVKGKKDSVRIGVIAVTIPSNPVPWVRYLDSFECARAEVEKLRPYVDVIVALTHVALPDDERMAEEIPAIDLIAGGHEHENYDVLRGKDFTPIRKADANARTVWVHELLFDTVGRKLQIESRLVRVDSSIPEDPAAARLVDRWMTAGFARFRESGFDPPAPVALSPVALDGRATAVSQKETNLTKLITEAMRGEVEQADLVLLNSGSIRVDDILPPGVLTQYDVLRTLPFGGRVLDTRIRGSLLAAVLDAGLQNRGTGGFLHTWNVSMSSGGEWEIGGTPLDPERIYRAAASDFLLTGRERGLGFLTREHSGVVSVAEKGDIRKAVIDELQKRWPLPR